MEKVCFQVLLAVSTAVFLCDSILIVPPDVHRGEDQHQQHSKAAEKRKDGNTLLLRLEDNGRQQKSEQTVVLGWRANENECCLNASALSQWHRLEVRIHDQYNCCATEEGSELRTGPLQGSVLYSANSSPTSCSHVNCASTQKVLQNWAFCCSVFSLTQTGSSQLTGFLWALRQSRNNHCGLNEKTYYRPYLWTCCVCAQSMPYRVDANNAALPEDSNS